MNIQLPIKNFTAQQTIFETNTKYTVVAKGRRFGFTKGCANNTIKWALAGKFKKGLWVDVVNGNIEKYVERYFIPVLKKLPANPKTGEDMWRWQKQQKVLTIGNAYVDFRSADKPENIEGFGYDYVVLNEAGIILKDSYLWHNAIKPMTWDDENCRVFIGGAPKGKGIFEELYNRGTDPDQPKYTSFKFTSFDNPKIQHQEILDDIKDTPERVVRQEIYAEFLDDNGVVFRDVKKVAILKEPQEPIDDHLYVIGCDLAKVQDYTVLTVYDRADNHQVYQMRFNKLDWPYQKEKIKGLADKYNHALVYMDTTGVGEPIYEDLVRTGVAIEPIHFTNEIKKQLIEKLANWIELQNLKMLQLEETINELNYFTYDYSEKTGRVIYNAPVGFHDDIVISHALAVWGLQPILESKKVEEMSLIARDLYEKTKTNQDEQSGVIEFEEYEEE